MLKIILILLGLMVFSLLFLLYLCLTYIDSSRKKLDYMISMIEKLEEERRGKKW